MGGGVWLTLVRLGASTILARVLLPSDFGLFGMALLAREFVVVAGNLGLTVGLIAKQDPTPEDLDTCFWGTAAVRVLMFLATFLLAPLAGVYFRDPRVVPVLRVVSCTFLMAPFMDVGIALLRKRLRFGTLAIIQGVAALFESGTAVFLSLTTTLGYWALVVGLLVNTALVTLGVLVAGRWRPGLKWNIESFKYLLNFGLNGLGFSLSNYLNQNIDYLLVGRLLGASGLGLYEFAYRIPHILLDRVARPVGAVVFPALSHVRHDDRMLVAGYVAAVKAVTLVTFPCLFGLAAVADVAVRVLWGERWSAIVVPLQILCVGAAFRTIGQPVGAIFYCKDRPDLPFKFSIMLTAFTFALVALLGWQLGVNGVAIGMALSVLPTVWIIKKAMKLVGADLSVVLRAILPALVASCFTFLMAWFVKTWLLRLSASAGASLFGGVVLGALVYIALLRLIDRATWEWAVSSMKMLFPASKET